MIPQFVQRMNRRERMLAGVVAAVVFGLVNLFLWSWLLGEIRTSRAEVAKRKQVNCKVSGIIASAKPGEWTEHDLAPIIKHVLEVFGPDRVMFGGDWPVCTLAAPLNVWIETLYLIVRDRSEEQLRKLFHDNAVTFYRLS